ncbi:MAG: TIM barrel protein [Candidatus Micrarchaeota archaeon]
MDIRFGPAGIPIQCKGSSTLEGVTCCRELGLDAMEMEFVHGVRMGELAAKEIAVASKKLDISLSSHAPYYINLCTDDEHKINNSKHHIFDAAKITSLAGGNITVFHPGFYQKLSPKEAYERAKKVLMEIEESLIQNNIKIRLGAENVGKKTAFGSFDENINLSSELEMVEPVIDFAHLHARGDFKIRGESDYLAIFEKLESRLGDYVKRFHCHFSEINYGDKGERNHLVLGSNNEPPYEPFIKVLAENGYCGTVICESPQIDIDAMKLMDEYKRMKLCS